MPALVRGEDGRILHDNLSDGDAHTLAGSVHANTGEIVEVVQLVLDGEAYVPDESSVKRVGAPPVIEAVEEVEEDEVELDEGETDVEPPTEEEPPAEEPEAA